MQVLVTGAGGFIGSYLVPALVGKHEVHALDVRVPGTQDAKSVSWIAQDLRRPLDRARMPGAIDAVVHLAQSPFYRQFPDKADDIFAVNVRGTHQLLEYARAVGAHSFILASSGGVCGHSPRPIRESAPLNPPDFYQASKCCAELLGAQYHSFFAVTTLRFFFVYGQHQFGMLIPTLLRKVLAGETVTVQGDPGLRVNPIHVTDAVSAIERALGLASQATVNVCGDEILTMTELVARVGQAVGIPARIEHAPAAEGGDLVGDNARMKSLLGVRPAMSLLDGIRGML